MAKKSNRYSAGAGGGLGRLQKARRYADGGSVGKNSGITSPDRNPAGRIGDELRNPAGRVGEEFISPRRK